MKALAWTLLIAACANAPLADGVQPPPPPTTPQATLFDPWNPPRFPEYIPPPVNAPAKIAYEPIVEDVTATATTSAVNAMPSNTIAMIAITDDGGSVVTADFQHTARLWPTLDGKHEPVVIALRPPTALALARDGEHLVIGALDGAGQLELVVAKRTGEPERRIAIEAPRPFAALHAAGTGFIALDDERGIRTITSEGKVSAPLVAEPEQFVASLVVRGSHVLAMVESEGTAHGRWLEATDPPRWGQPTPVLPIASDRVALSPDGKYVAGVLKGGKRVGLVELATGKVVARTAEEESDPQLRPIGFVDANWVAIAGQFGDIRWWRRSLSNDSFFSEPAVAVGDRVAVGAQSTGLVISRPHEPSAYVGYRMGGPSTLHAFGDRLIATDSMSIVELDAKFRTRKVHTLPPMTEPTVGSWSNLMVIDERHVLASTYVGNHYVVYLIPLDGKEAKLVVQDGYPSEYEPSTQLLTYRTSDAFAVTKFDRESGAFGKPVLIPFDNKQNALIKLLNPKHAKGNLAGVVEANGSNARITMISAFHPEQPSSQLEISSMTTIELDDRWWAKVGDYAKLVDPGSPKVRGPGGKRAEIRGNRIVLTDASGAKLWEVPARSASGLLWTGSGRLVAFGSGVAELDVATGALGARQCGWAFGRWDLESPAFGTAHLCEAQ